MKNLVFLFSLLVAMTFVSCSKEDPRPAPGQVSATFPIEFGIVAASGATATAQSAPATINLSTILTQSGNQDKEKYVSGSVVSNASTIVFRGITGTGATLSNITFATADGTIKNVVLNDTFSRQPLVLSKDTTLTMGDQNYFNFLGQIGSYLVSQKKIELKATYTVSNQPITSGKVTLNITTTFGWN